MSAVKELKLKARVPDFSSVREKLKLPAKFSKSAEYTDYFFKSDSGTPISELRIRNRDEGKTITIKILLERNHVQVNTIYSFTVDFPEDFVSFIETLGFHAHSELRKNSEVYLAGDIRIELAKIKDLGNYVELTLQTFEDAHSRIPELESFAEKLGLKKEQTDSRFYSQIKKES
jgi:predicted adenylyl cyclase CyaB